MILNFNFRRLTSFGKLIAVANRHFNIEFALLANRSYEIVTCKPFFEKPDWARLPQLEPSSILSRKNVPSFFSLPKIQQLEFFERHKQGFSN